MERMTNDALRRALAERINEQWEGTFTAGVINEWCVADMALAALGLDDLDAAVHRAALKLHEVTEFKPYESDVRLVLEAALTCSATQETQNGD